MNEIKKGRNWEGVLVVIILLIILAIVIPYVVSATYKVNVRSAKVSAEGLVSAIENAYFAGNLTGIMTLPFEIKYENQSYTASSNGKEISLEIKTEGKIPNSGSVILNKSGEIIVKDLKYGYVSCHKEALDSEITCK